MSRQTRSERFQSRPLCTVRLDRVQFRARAWGLKLLLLLGFVRMRGGFVRSQTTVTTYRREDRFLNRRTGTKVYLQHDRACPWLWPLKVTVVPDDGPGLCGGEVQRMLGAFTNARLLRVEVALDFTAGSGIDRSFVLRHGLFGKSRLVGGRLYKDLRYGSHYSDIFVRGYEKPAIESYRVESQLQSGWLRARGIQRFGDLARLPTQIVPGRVGFFRIDWDALAGHLARKKMAAEPIIRKAQTRIRSLHTVLDYLRHDVGVANVHRFLRPLAVNRQIRGALRTWARQWAVQGKG